MVGDQPLEQAAPLRLRAIAQVDAVELEDVVGDEADRRIGQHLLRQRLAADALLQERERRHLAVLPDHRLAVEHGAVGQRRGGGDDLREALGDEFLAARPDPDLRGPLDQLRADAVVLPLDDPVAGRRELRLELLGQQIELVGEEERIRLAEIERAGRGRSTSAGCSARRSA